MWVARESSARLHGAGVGAMGPAPGQAQLRDFAIPQRGVFVVGRAFFATQLGADGDHQLT